jgi:hypothetical protein
MYCRIFKGILFILFNFIFISFEHSCFRFFFFNINRFCDDKNKTQSQWLQKCINEFNEPIDFVVPSFIPKDIDINAKIKASVTGMKKILESHLK